MYDYYIDKYIPAREEKEYLKSAKVDLSDIAMIIYYSYTHNLEEKLKDLMSLNELALKEGTEEFIKSSELCIWNIKKALEYIDVEGIFTLEEGCYSGYTNSPEETSLKVYDNYTSVKKAMARYEEVWADDADEPHYMYLCKWIKDKEGLWGEKDEYIKVAYYDVVYCELVACQLEDKFADDKYIDLYRGTDLNLPVCYHAGDILEIDGTPFYPKCRVLIISVGDNQDCCCVQALSYNPEKKMWQQGALKHGHICGRSYPQVSPLYTASLYTEPLAEDEKLLFDVSNYIKGNREREKKVKETLWISETEEDIRKLIST